MRGDGESANLFLIRPNFPENCMKIKKIGPRGERRASKILLGRSATACRQICFQFHEVFRKFSKVNPGVCSFCRNFAKLCGAPGFWETVFDNFSCFYIEIVYSNFTFCGAYIYAQFSSAPHNFSKTSTPPERWRLPYGKSCYRPQTKFAKIMFLHQSVSHSVHGGGGGAVWLSACTP